MFAIEVKYLGPTDTKGGRYKVSQAGYKSKLYPFDYSMRGLENILHAVEDFTRDHAASCWVGAEMPGGSSWVFVRVPLGTGPRVHFSSIHD